MAIENAANKYLNGVGLEVLVNLLKAKFNGKLDTNGDASSLTINSENIADLINNKLNTEGDASSLTITIDNASVNLAEYIEGLVDETTLNGIVQDLQKQIENLVAEGLGGISGALIYRGVITSNTTTSTSSFDKKDGDVFVVGNEGITTNSDLSYTFKDGNVILPAGKYEPGDYFIVTGDKFNAISGENQVENKDAELKHNNTLTTIATVDGTDINVKLPEYTKVTANDPTGSYNTDNKKITVTIPQVSQETTGAINVTSKSVEIDVADMFHDSILEEDINGLFND